MFLGLFQRNLRLTPELNLVHPVPGKSCDVDFSGGRPTYPTCLTQNHSCDPNVFINPVYVNDADFDKPLFCMFTSRAIKPYEELSFSYTGDDDDDSMVRVV